MIIRAPWLEATEPVDAIQVMAMPVTASAATVTSIVIMGVEISPLLFLFIGLIFLEKKLII